MRLAFALLSVGSMILVLSLAYIFAGQDARREAAPQALNEAPSLPTRNSAMLKLRSAVFEEGGLIPSDYTCDGANGSPELVIEGIPEGAVSLVLIMDDPDIPDFVKEKRGIDVFDHWVLFNIPVSGAQMRIAEGSVPDNARQGVNSSGSKGYVGPCPPDGEHRYFWKLYALDRMLELDEGATKRQVEEAMRGAVLEETTLIGRYARIAP